jgi:hypothetical protein
MTDEIDDSYTVPFSMRLTRAQRRKLGAEAGSQTVGDYVRSRLFENPTPLKRTFRRPLQDEKALSQVLGALGNSRLSSNLNQIAKAAHSGSLLVTPETEKAIFEACTTIKNMGNNLMQALGLEPEKKSKKDENNRP